MQVLRDRVAEPENLFYCPGSLLQNEFDPSIIRWRGACRRRGRSSSSPIRRTACGRASASRRRSPRAIRAQNILQSGWLLGEEYLKDQANVVSFRVGKGYVVTYGSQIDFRTQPRATFKLLFNGMFHGPSTAVPAAQMGRLAPATTNENQRVRNSTVQSTSE